MSLGALGLVLGTLLGPLFELLGALLGLLEGPFGVSDQENLYLLKKRAARLDGSIIFETCSSKEREARL